MKSSFANGYNTFSDIAGAAHGSYRAESYVGRISDACKELEDNINKFKGFETGIKQLKGDIQEFRSSGTFNINAALNESEYQTVVDRINKHKWDVIDAITIPQGVKRSEVKI